MTTEQINIQMTTEKTYTWQQNKHTHDRHTTTTNIQMISNKHKHEIIPYGEPILFELIHSTNDAFFIPHNKLLYAEMRLYLNR